MAVIEPLRKSPSSRIWVSMRERCCSRAARDSGKGHLQSERKYTLGLYTQKKKTAKCLPVGRTPLRHSALDFFLEFPLSVLRAASLRGSAGSAAALAGGYRGVGTLGNDATRSPTGGSCVRI